MGKEELPQGGVVELATIVALNALDLAAELSTDKRKELGDSRKGVRFHTQRKNLRVVQKIIKNDKIIFKT
jgi:hypothetical protein